MANGLMHSTNPRNDAPGAAQSPFFPVAGSDLLIALSLVLFAAFVAVRQIHWHFLPEEDALMMMRYADHLSSGHGIVWNIGDRPVEGATDFLFLVVLSAWIKISHLDSILAIRSLLLVSHLATVGFLYLSVRRLFAAPIALAAALALYLATGPGIVHASNGFSPPFFGLMALVAWYFALATVVWGVTLSRSVCFATFALLAGLTRPDGVFLAVFMTCAVLYAIRGKARSFVGITVGFFVVLGGTYFLWRFHYFGYLLPNPFYKKGGGHLYPQSLTLSIRFVIEMLLPWLPIYVVGLCIPRARRNTIFAMIPIACFTCIWVLLSIENNLAMRFQYVVVPLGLMSVPLIWNSIREDLNVHGFRFSIPPAPRYDRLALVACLLLAVPISMLWWEALYPWRPAGSGSIVIASALSKWKDRHYTIFATEAGVIPYLSQWRTIDAWGLNDAEVVHNPAGLTNAYLDLNHPAVISFYLSPHTATGHAASFDMPSFYQVWNGQPPVKRDISQLEVVMSNYAMTHNYGLAARWGASACSVNVYYVSRNIPEYDEMVAAIRREPNFDPYHEGALQQNFLGAPPPTCSDPYSAGNIRIH